MVKSEEESTGQSTLHNEKGKQSEVSLLLNISLTIRITKEGIPRLILVQDWIPSHGGEIRLYPLPCPSVDMAPLMDRFILFCSTQMLHRVLPATSFRYCLSLWFAASSPQPFPSRFNPSGKLEQRLVNSTEGKTLLSLLYQNNTRRMLSKVFYAQEWDEVLSLYLSFLFFVRSSKVSNKPIEMKKE